MLNDLQKALKADLRVQVTVWDSSDESVEHTFHSYVMQAVGLLFKVAAPVKDADIIVPLMGKGLVVGVVLEAFPAPFIFYPTILELPKRPTDGYWFSVPTNAEVEVFQRRKHVRISMVVPFEAEIPATDSSPLVTVAARTSDVSGGGLRLTSSYNFSSGQVLLLNLKFDDEQPLMHLKALVILSTENRVRKHPEDLYATACQFLNLDNAQEMMIVRECFRCELKLKQKQ